MYVFLPKETFFISRTGKAHQCWTVDNTGELVSIKKTATLTDIAFVEGENFYTHWQGIVRYYTVGAEELIMIQEFKAQLPNVGFHGIHDRYVAT
jgi:hypothetical protein